MWNLTLRFNQRFLSPDLFLCVFYGFLRHFIDPFIDVAIITVLFDDFVDDLDEVFIALRYGDRGAFAVYFEEYIRRSQVRIRDEVLSADDALYRDSIDFALLKFQKCIRNLRQRYDLCIFDLLVGQLFLQGRLLDGDLFAIEISQRLVLACIFLTDKEGMLADEIAVGEIDSLLSFCSRSNGGDRNIDLACRDRSQERLEGHVLYFELDTELLRNGFCDFDIDPRDGFFILD